jgi:hypothetical protein
MAPIMKPLSPPLSHRLSQTFLDPGSRVHCAKSGLLFLGNLVTKTDGHHPSSMARQPETPFDNPNGIESISPGLHPERMPSISPGSRGTRHPGSNMVWGTSTLNGLNQSCKNQCLPCLRREIDVSKGDTTLSGLRYLIVDETQGSAFRATLG